MGFSLEVEALMHPVIEKARADALAAIRRRRPQRTKGGTYVCTYCTASGDKGFSLWHTCRARGFTVEEARYAQGMMAVRPTDNIGDFKGRAARLLEHLRGRWSNREHAYIISPSKVMKLEKLYAAGRDASAITGELYEQDALTV
jgi:hypothetical protein